MNIDLHIHTNASDGSYSPSEILAFARERRLGAISITDHDTIGGVKAYLDECGCEEVQFLTGVEITAQAPPAFHLSDSLHVLGYGIRVDDPELNRLLGKLQTARDERTPGMVARLQDLGMDLTLGELAATFPGPQLGRPHIAQLMVRKGYAASIDDAFDRFLGSGKPGYVDKTRISYEEAAGAIGHAGGLVVLAHPGLYDMADDVLDRLLGCLKEGCLQGIEIYYPEHSGAHISLYERLAEKYGLIATGGTDFHGAATPGIDVGAGRGDFHVPYALYEKIMEILQADQHG